MGCLLLAFAAGACRPPSMTPEEQQTACREADEANNRFLGDTTELVGVAVRLRRTVRANPNNAEAKALLARTVFNLGAPLEMFAALNQKALDADPQNPTAIFNQASILRREGDLSGAEAWLAKADQLHADPERLLLMRSEVAEAEHRDDDALQGAKQLLAQTKKVAYQNRALIVMARLVASPSDVALAKSGFETLIAAHPESAWLKNNYSILFDHLEDYDTAIAWGQKALAQADAPAMRRSLSSTYADQGIQRLKRDNRPQEAKQAFQAAVAVEPDNGVWYYDVATAELALGETAAARNDLQKALSLDPDFAPAKDALDRLR